MAAIDNIFGSHTLGITYRPFQNKIINTVKEKLKQGSRKLHIVSPPGTGKTLMGLAIIEMIGLPAIVLCPNTTIQMQWLRKAEDFLVDTDPIGFDKAEKFVGTNPEENFPVVVMTYQLFSLREDREKEAKRLFSGMVEKGYKTIVLDECHHLTGYWAEVIQGFLHEYKDIYIIGLTATPPFDRSEREHRRFLSIVGTADVEISLPSVIRDGLLTPFQDLAYFVVPTEEEIRLIKDHYMSVSRLIRDLEHPPGELDSLGLRVEQQMMHPFLKEKDYVDFINLSVEEPDFATALARYARTHGILFPENSYDPEPVPQPLSMDDLALLLEDYLLSLPASNPEAARLSREILSVMEGAGFTWTGKTFDRKFSLVDKTLALSGAKLAALKQILIREIETMGDELRVLVLTDFIHIHSRGGENPEDILDPSAGGAIAAFRAILENKITDTLDPILVTGKIILVDDEIKERVLQFAHQYLKENNLNADLEAIKKENFYILKGTGSGWGTKVYVELLTEILHRGITRCIVGTRALFGEGWDCESLNTLIDMTAVSSFVTVNQVRGRTLRLDPANMAKTSNNWDIVAILPDIIGGETDLNRFLKKHERFYGPTDDGDLEKGAGHVHPSLTHLSLDRLVEKLEDINGQLLEWSGNRGRAFHTWKVGTPYKEEEVAALELFEWKEGAKSSGIISKNYRSSLWVTHFTPPFRLAPWGRSILISIVFPFILKLFGIGIPGFLPGLLCAIGAWFIFMNIYFHRFRFRTLKAKQKITLEDFLLKTGRVLSETLKDLELLPWEAVPVIGKRSDGSLRVRLENGTAETSRIFMETMKEFLGPYRAQRYLLTGYMYEIKLNEFGKFLKKAPDFFKRPYISFPVPMILGKHKRNASLLADNWSREFGPTEVHYVGSKSSKRDKIPLLMPLTANRPSLRQVIHRLWR